MLFFVLCACLLGSSAKAQQAIPPAGFKDPGTATLLSVVVPGGGQLYSGDMRKGLTLLGVGLGGVTIGTAMTISSAGVSCSDISCESHGSALPAVLGTMAYLGSWVYGIMDASDSANRMNAKNRMAGVLQANVSPVIGPNGGGGTQVGVAVRF
jgi:hypothetical protein